MSHTEFICALFFAFLFLKEFMSLWALKAWKASPEMEAGKEEKMPNNLGCETRNTSLIRQTSSIYLPYLSVGYKFKFKHQPYVTHWLFWLGFSSNMLSFSQKIFKMYHQIGYLLLETLWFIYKTLIKTCLIYNLEIFKMPWILSFFAFLNIHT